MKTIPYGKQTIDRLDIAAVLNVMKSDWITQGPKVMEFEEELRKYCGARYAVAVSSGTAALHIACLAAGLKNGHEAITSPVTFVATANAVIYSNAKPIFADIDPLTYNINPSEIIKKLNGRTRVILPVHFAGLPCDMAEIARIAKKRGIIVIEDACHALGAQYKCGDRWIRVGSCEHSDMTVFSFHPVKTITTGEGGAVTTNSKTIYKKLLSLRSHGIYKDGNMLKKTGPWFYEMRDLGFNYRITDIQCALGLSQLKKIDGFLSSRESISALYSKKFRFFSDILKLPYDAKDVRHAHHLYVIKLDFKNIKKSRKLLMKNLKNMGIATQVHYIPVYRHPYYFKKYRINCKDFPMSEDYYNKALSLPIYPGMRKLDIGYIVDALIKVSK